MAFINKIGNILKQTQPSFSNASIYQAIRCFSSSKLFVGGLSFATDENSLREAFAPYGDVVEARIIVDRTTGQSRGFGFVSYPSVEEASAAIQALDGRDLHGRFIRVAYSADQRSISRGPRYSNNVGYGTDFGGTNGYGESHSQTHGKYNGGGSNYGSGAAGGFENHNTAGAGSTGGNWSAGDGYGGQHVSTVGESYSGNGESYDGMGQGHGHWQGGNIKHDKDDNFSSEDGTSGHAKARFG